MPHNDNTTHTVLWDALSIHCKNAYTQLQQQPPRSLPFWGGRSSMELLFNDWKHHRITTDINAIEQQREQLKYKPNPVALSEFHTLLRQHYPIVLVNYFTMSYNPCLLTRSFDICQMSLMHSDNTFILAHNTPDTDTPQNSAVLSCPDNSFLQLKVIQYFDLAASNAPTTPITKHVGLGHEFRITLNGTFLQHCLALDDTSHALLTWNDLPGLITTLQLNTLLPPVVDDEEELQFPALSLGG